MISTVMSADLASTPLPLPGFGGEPTRAKLPLVKRQNWHRGLAIAAMGFSTTGPESVVVQKRLRRFVRAFIGSHTGISLRRLTKDRKDILVEKLKSGGDIVGEHIRYSTSGPNPDCRMTFMTSREYWIHKKRRPTAKLQMKDYPADLEWDDVYQHLLGDIGGPLFLQWCYLDVSGNTPVPYLVLDLDDKKDSVTWPEAPQKKIRNLLRFLADTKVLDPARAVMVSSPGGRGRHLYYFLDGRQKASEIHMTVSKFLVRQWQQRKNERLETTGSIGVDVFPKKDNRSTMPALPLGRGSVPCDANGMPSKRREIADRLRIVLKAVKRAREKPLNLEELRFGADACAPSGDPVFPSESHTHDGDAADRPIDADHDQDVFIRRILNRGITGGGQRYHFSLALLAHYQGAGLTRDAAVKAVSRWLAKHHHGKSDKYNADPDRAMGDIEKWSRSVYKDCSPESLRLSPAQVGFLYDRIVGYKGKAVAYSKDRIRKLLRFAVFFFAQLEAFADSTCHHGGEHPLEAAVAASVMEKFSGGSGPARRKNLKALQRLRIILVTRKPMAVPFGMPGARATTYALHADYPRRVGQGERAEPALISYLSKSARWKAIADKQAWRRWRQRVAQIKS